MNVDKLIAEWDVQHEKDQEKFNSLFPDTDDILAIVLRGHLMVEEYLDRLNRHCFHYPEYYDQANLQFSKKLLIARAQVLVPHLDPTSFFDGIKKLNELRNNLAHNLDSPKLTDKSTEFLHLVEADYSQRIKQRCDYKNDALEVRLRKAISYLLGQLSLLDNVIEFMEKSHYYGSGEHRGAVDSLDARD